LRLKYDEIVTICLAAIKEQSSYLDVSETKIQKLEDRIREKGLI